MSQNLTFTASAPRRAEILRGLAILLVMAAVGLYIVKWSPYYHRAHLLSGTHSMGRDMLFFKGVATPAPSLTAAMGYATGYFKAIWQAWVLGLLLAATIEAFLPRNWLAHMLGKASAHTSLLGGVLALPGMM
jgi:uncharacterized protein